MDLAHKVYITGDINSAVVTNVFQQVQEINLRHATTKWDESYILIVINSNGGNTASAFAIMSILKTLPKKASKLAINIGEASSSAFDIFLSFKNRASVEGSVFVLHYAQLYFGGGVQPSWLEREAEVLKKMNAKMIRCFKRKLKLTKTDYKIMKQGGDVLIYNKQAFKKGLINYRFKGDRMDKVKFRRRLNNVINTLYKLPEEIRLGGHHLDMEEGLVHSPRTDFTNECGTVHCLGGWYLLAKYWSDVDGAKGLFSNGKRDVNKGVSYTEGINAMMEDLTGDLFKLPVGWIPCDTVFDRLDVLEWLLTEEEWGNCLIDGIFFDYGGVSFRL